MRLLLTNDDGFDAPGINVLRKRLLEDGHEVFVMAPASNQSGTSQSIHISGAIQVKKISDNIFSCAGSPADCVMTAIHAGVFGRPDLMLSGINRGPNLGLDILYSGTCGAARQGVLMGIPSAALSVMKKEGEIFEGDGDSESDYFAMADFAAKNLDALKSLARVSDGCRMPEEICVFPNVNGLAQTEPYKGAGFAGVAFREYIGDKLTLNEKGAGLYERIFTSGKARTVSRGYSDYEACVEGYAAITRIYAEPAAAPILDGIKFTV